MNEHKVMVLSKVASCQMKCDSILFICQVFSDIYRNYRLFTVAALMGFNFMKLSTFYDCYKKLARFGKTMSDPFAFLFLVLLLLIQKLLEEKENSKTSFLNKVAHIFHLCNCTTLYPMR